MTGNQSDGSVATGVRRQDDVSLSIGQIDGAWRLMCGGGPRSVIAETEGIHYIFGGLPVSFFNLALLTGSGLSAEALSARAREACAWAAQALENAARSHGEAPTVLHATDAGRPVYERMGYASISTHTLLMEKRFLEEH